MKYPPIFTRLAAYFLAFGLIACNGNNATPSKELINQLQLKRGALISCSPGDQQFGKVDFEIAGTEKTKKDFNLAVALLHSFEYDESEKVFAKILDETPGCAMAYWGVAMCNFMHCGHPLLNRITKRKQSN